MIYVNTYESQLRCEHDNQKLGEYEGNVERIISGNKKARTQ